LPRPELPLRPAIKVLLSGLFALALLAGCHSRFVEVTIDNQGSTPLRLVEVDYPSASFGAEQIAANSVFHYRFKIQGAGPVKLEFTDAQGQTHTVDGPELHEGEEGHLAVVVDATGKVSWQPALTTPK
jgi:hypothetical protein